uniref:RNA-directed DNA polymerase n=1 Tax=Lutzomyia longipalpis TaxID=7200 RepID=A0A7G3ANC8_LUTLO
MGGQVMYSLEELTVFCKRIEQTEKLCEVYEKSVTKKVDKVAAVGVESAKKGCEGKIEMKKEKKIERKVDDRKTVEKKKDSFSCANCFGSGHGVLRCPEKRRARFLCYQCGAVDVTTKTCKSCNKGGEFRQGGSKTSSEEEGETQVCVVYAESRQGDNRMFVDVDVNGVVVKGMLDSGATTSVLGRGWREIVNKAKLKVRKSEVRGRSATGMRMRGGLEVEVPVAFNGRSQILTIPIFPEVTEDLLLGMDFWREFGLSPALPFIHEQSVASIDVEAWLSQDQKRMIEECVKLFPVTSEGNFGCTPLVSHSIDTGDAKPTVQRCYPVSPHVLKAADEELHRMEKLGVIKKCAKSPWRSAMTVTTKANGKIRLCLDARALNKVTVKDTYPMPHLENILSNLGGTKYLSAIDLSDAYWQVPLDEEAQAKTAFALIGRPLFMFARMPFGLVGAPATMARLADAVIGPELAPHVWTYLDDIIVATDDFESHVKYLKIVAERLKMAKLTINRDKSKFCVPELRYLGFVVNEEGIKIEPDKIEAIQNYPKPSTVKEVRQLLGMCGWNRRFIKDYAKIMAPISNLLKGKPNRIVWTSEAERAFEEIKRALGSAPILRNPKYDRVFHVCTDASDVGIGAQLTQRDDNGDEYTVTYISQKLSETQKKWSIGERECLSVIVALNKWRHYLEGSKVVLVTDSEALKWLLKQGDAKGRIGRWALQIQQFDFSVVHRSGCNNIIPDALSRNISELAEEAVDPEGHEVCAVDRADEEGSICTGDDWYDELVNKVKKMPEKFPEYKLIENELYSLCDDGSWKIVVPVDERLKILKKFHDDPKAAHFGNLKTLKRIVQRYWWPGLARDVKMYVGQCEVCRKIKDVNVNLTPPMGQPRIVKRCWEAISIDYMGPFPRSRFGNTQLLVIVDLYSKFPLIFPLRNAGVGLLKKTLETHVFNVFGVPRIVISDNGTQFVSHEFQSFLREFNITHQKTAVYSPNGNPVERVNKVIGTAIRGYVKDASHTNWDRHIGEIGMAIRSAMHEVTGRTPYYLNFGMEMAVDGGDYLPEEIQLNTDFEKRVNDLLSVRKDIPDRIREGNERNAKRYNLRNRAQPLRRKQVVWRRNFPISDAGKRVMGKLMPKWLKAEVVEELGSNLYVVKDHATGRKITYHRKDLDPRDIYPN